MIRRSLSPIRWAWLIPVASAAGLLLILNRCEQNPIIADLPGSGGVLEGTTISTMLDTVFVRTPSHGGSLTLYAGFTQDPFRESGILMRFAGIDSSDLTNALEGRIILFRRLFGDALPDPTQSFALKAVDTLDTIWSESDTGLTVASFSHLEPIDVGFMVEDSILAYDGNTSTSMSRVHMEHLIFEVDTLFLRGWHAGEKASNGFLLQLVGEGGLFSFHSRQAIFTPYLAVDIHDTTSSGEDTIRTTFLKATEDLSIFRSDASTAPSNGDGKLLHVNHSEGFRSHLGSIGVDSTSMVASARLILHVESAASRVSAGQVALRILQRGTPWGQEDSTVAYVEATYTDPVGSDSLVLYLRDIVAAFANRPSENHGLDIVVRPRHNDFDHLYFWGPDTSESLRPRLEIIYSRPYEEVP